MRFDLYAEEALYGPQGFYTQHGRAGTISSRPPKRARFLVAVWPRI